MPYIFVFFVIPSVKNHFIADEWQNCRQCKVMTLLRPEKSYWWNILFTDFVLFFFFSDMVFYHLQLFLSVFFSFWRFMFVYLTDKETRGRLSADKAARRLWDNRAGTNVAETKSLFNIRRGSHQRHSRGVLGGSIFKSLIKKIAQQISSVPRRIWNQREKYFRNRP